MNSAVSALRFFFTNTLDRPDLARKLAYRAAQAGVSPHRLHRIYSKPKYQYQSAA